MKDIFRIIAGLSFDKVRFEVVKDIFRIIAGLSFPKVRFEW